MTIDEIVNLYAEELSNWEFFSDSQKAYVDENKHIVVCLRNYNWYVTKNPITNIKDAIKALFEIDWIAEYDDGGMYHFVDYSKVWRKI